MSEQLYTISYFSRNAIPSHDIAGLTQEISAILTTSRRNNVLRGITGALLYSAGCFAQVLEGPLSEVETTFERVQLDPRHRDVKVLQFHPLDHRSFGDWSMAFAGIDPDAPERARFDDALADSRNIIAEIEGLDVIAVLRDLMARHEIHRV